MVTMPKAPAYARIRDLPVRTWAWFAAIFVLFYIAFRWYPHLAFLDRLAGTDLRFYIGTWAIEPNSLIVGRLAQDAAGGVFSEGLSIGLDGAYTRQFGLAGWLLSVPAFGLAGFSAAGVGVMISLVCALSAAIASGFIMTMRRMLGRGSAILAGLVLLLPWAIAISRSMYWTIGLKLLPAVILIWAYRSSRRSAWRIFTLSLVFTAISAMSGYEYFTIVAATQLAVVAYYSVVERWTFGNSLRNLALVLSSMVAGFITAVALHVIQLYLRSGDLTRITELQKSALTRTGTGASEAGFSPDVALATSPLTVLDTYFKVPVLGVQQSLPFVQQFTVAALVTSVALLVLAGLSRNAVRLRVRREQGLGIAWFVSLMGPLGWILLARPHSVMHTFMNVSLWFLPTIPLGFALAWPPVRRGLATTRSYSVPLLWLALVALGFLVFFAYSQVTVK